ncbi:MAG: gliding motility-associated ABC transporter permease subunit GldF [Saprospirales bacterium]|nr:gliding motility-associated ABC transporter permease subunit GldF [Saprospirales bacterium]|tara:strand:- start:8817 stop:9563 length:747 start_codon:yes stop_codon:yes gene_type:complete
MISIYKKEFIQFFGQIIGYASIALFVLLTGLYVWVFPSHSILERTILSLDPFFTWAPIFLILVVSAATMRQFAEESAEGTLELLVTKPLSSIQIVLGKYFAAISIVAITLMLTAATYIPSVQALALDNVFLDYGSILGAYLGLMLLGMTFSAVGLFTSILLRSQVVAFLLSASINAMGYLGFELISEKKQFAGYWDFVINGMGFKAHYESISLGLLDFADVAYFMAIIVTFLSLAILIIGRWPNLKKP